MSRPHEGKLAIVTGGSRGTLVSMSASDSKIQARAMRARRDCILTRLETQSH